MKTYLVCFSSGLPGFENGMRRLTASAEIGGIDEVIRWKREDLCRTPRFTGEEMFNRRPHGLVYGWKPYIILDLMQQIAAGDVIVYHDVGGYGKQKDYHFRQPIRPLLDWCCDAADGILPGMTTGYAHEHWTSRDCFVFMDCDCERYWNLKQVQTTYSFWRKSELTLDVLRQWEHFCNDNRTLDGHSNASGLAQRPGFREHRYDQSIMTNLVERFGLMCYGEPLEQGGNKDINQLIDRVKAGTP